MEKMYISGVAKDKNVVRISLINLKDIPGMAFKIFSALAQKKVNVDIILQSIGRDGLKDISFTVDKGNRDLALAVLNDNKDIIGMEDVKVSEDVCKLSIVGAGMINNPGVAATMFEALASAGINIQMISTSEIKISVLIAEADGDRALKAVHEKFFS